MKGKVGYVIVTAIVFLVGVLVGELASGGLSKKHDMSGQTLEAKLTEIDQKLTLIDQAVTGGGPFDPNKEYTFNLKDAPVMGNASAKVKLVLWSDFQCPYCKKMHTSLEGLIKSNPDKFALYMKDRIVHPTAQLEHEAAQAAKAQGKYFEMADLLFDNQQELEGLSRAGEENQANYEAKLAEYAKQLGMNVDQFKADLDSHKYKDILDAEQQEANTSEINSTPTVFINDHFYGYDPEALKAKATELLSSAGGEKPKKEGIEAKIDSIDQKLEKLTKLFEERKKQAQQPHEPVKGKEYGFDLGKGQVPVIGDANAKVKVVIFSDFQCPYCDKMAGILEGLQKDHPQDIAIFYKNYVVHQGALLEHEAAMSAFDQGKFKQMHDLLFANREQLTQISGQGEDKLKEKLLELGKQAGLNVTKLKSDLESGKYQEIITSNIKEGQQANVNGTPSVFINGFFYGYNPEDVKKQIEEAVKK
jgi:protein-disulfide isomerase